MASSTCTRSRRDIHLDPWAAARPARKTSRRAVQAGRPGVASSAVAVVAVVAATASIAGCDGDVVFVGRFDGTTSTTSGAGEGGSRESSSATSVGGSTGADGGPSTGSAGAADAGVGGSGDAASTGTGAPAYPEAYLEACTALCERSVELRAETQCIPMPEDDDDCSTPGRWQSSWGFCEGDAGLPPECLAALAPVIACYAASVEARDCFCEFECSYFPACDALFKPPSNDTFSACPGIGGTDGIVGGEACGPELPDCVEGTYCDYADDLCGAGEFVGACRPEPLPGYPSPWDDVCGCDGQPYDNLVDALAAGTDIGPVEACGPGEGGAAGAGGSGP